MNCWRSSSASLMKALGTRAVLFWCSYQVCKPRWSLLLQAQEVIDQACTECVSSHIKSECQRLAVLISQAARITSRKKGGLFIKQLDLSEPGNVQDWFRTGHKAYWCDSTEPSTVGLASCLSLATHHSGMGEISQLLSRLSSTRKFSRGSHWLVPLHSSVSPADQRQAFRVPPKGWLYASLHGCSR